MNRPLMLNKLKFYHHEKKEIFVVDAYHLIDNIIEILDFNNDATYFDVKKGDLIHFTGRTDTLGVDIYEGDIVEYKGYKGEIIWLKEAWRIKYREVGFEQTIPLGSVSGKDLKVVGDIYEPEP